MMMINRIADEVRNWNLNNFWPNFETTAFALYNETTVYLFNHPNYQSQEGYKILEWSTAFIGDSLILFEEYPTAIINLEYHSTYENLYSIIIHELFHGNQYLKGEKRFPNELIGITYPIDRMNIALRTAERECLYKAVFAENEDEKNENIKKFVAYRKKRSNLIGENFQYETAIETTEGPAWYVEWKAYCDKSSLTKDEILAQYGKELLDPLVSSVHLRRSCYSTGLFMCILLDYYMPEWKDKFFEYNGSLYDLLKLHFNVEDCVVEDTVNRPDIDEVVRTVIKDRESALNSYEEKQGYHLWIEGEVKIRTLDPMNIVSFEDRLLHKNYLKLVIQQQDYLFQQPIVTYIGDKNLFFPRKVHFVMSSKPDVKENAIHVQGVGDIKGEYEIKDNHIFIRV